MNDMRMISSEASFRYYNPVLGNEAFFRYWRLCAVMGPVFLAAFLVCWGVLGYNIPPIPADFTAGTLAARPLGLTCTWVSSSMPAAGSTFIANRFRKLPPRSEGASP